MIRCLLDYDVLHGRLRSSAVPQGVAHQVVDRRRGGCCESCLPVAVNEQFEVVIATGNHIDDDDGRTELNNKVVVQNQSQ
ncbi:MAG: hypothetical protein J07HQX50_02664 [Haloquadratum sp. J07HQX50]|nr:MAG: hypothetical protein J07HQX50_02664 [Haloquadratum sp. J07HQX50]